MGTAILKIKLMPESPETNLDDLKITSTEIVTNEQGSNIRFEKIPIAFGLTALEVLFTRDETLDSDELVKKLNDLPGIKSAEIIDFRRAFG
ncbi:elongation factor 1-beta [Candidatus Pacearchaeota archaeon]|nr:elongation factor 1-beta [Candidatus Pacearchaeota archaeon]